MGWYTALILAKAVSAEDGIRLIETMASYQKNNVIGGQILLPTVDENWLHSIEYSEKISTLLSEIPDLHVSIRLGGQMVLGGSKDALKIVKSSVPAFNVGSTTYPLELPLHSAFHTPLMQHTSESAQADLATMEFSPPQHPLSMGMLRSGVISVRQMLFELYRGSAG